MLKIKPIDVLYDKFSFKNSTIYNDDEVYKKENNLSFKSYNRKLFPKDVPYLAQYIGCFKKQLFILCVAQSQDYQITYSKENQLWDLSNNKIFDKMVQYIMELKLHA